MLNFENMIKKILLYLSLIISFVISVLNTLSGLEKLIFSNKKTIMTNNPINTINFRSFCIKESLMLFCRLNLSCIVKKYI